jgi:hypothetical protein
MTRKTVIIYISALLLLTGCQADKTDDPRQDGLVPVTLTASQGSILSISGGMTRATDGLYSATSGFTGGEAVRVFLNNSSSYSDYTVGTPSAGVSSLTGGTLYYPPSGDITLFAVYPAASASSHTVAYDQSSDDNYKASDLMYATKTVAQADKTAAQNLEFAHQLVKLKLNIIKGAGITSVTEVKMKNVKRTVSVAPTTSSVGVGSATSTGDENGDEILIYSGSNTSSETQTYACVFPTQAWNDADFITVTADSKTVTYQLDRSEWTAGAEYELTFHLNAVALNTTISITGWTDSNPSVVVNPSANTGMTLTISDVDAQTYTGSAITPAVTVKAGETTLAVDTDYELRWDNNTNAGIAMVAAIGKGTYFGQFATQTFVINKAAGNISFASDTVNKTTVDSPFTNELTKIGDGIVTYKSSKTDVATVNDEGLVTIVAAGTTTITATVADGTNYTYASNTATYTLTIN